MTSALDGMWGTPQVKPSTKPKTEQRSKNRSEVKGPFYQELFQICIDKAETEKWKLFYQECKNGSFPPAFTLRNTTLYYKKGGKKFEKSLIQLCSMEPDVKFKMIHDFFSTHTKTNEDAEKALEKFENFLESKSKPIIWSLLRRKHQTALTIIGAYCDNVKETMAEEGITISDHTLKMLFNMLNIGLISGVIDNDDVEIYNGQLINVRCIYWNSEIKQFSLIEDHLSHYNHYIKTREPFKKKKPTKARKNSKGINNSSESMRGSKGTYQVSF